MITPTKQIVLYVANDPRDGADQQALADFIDNPGIEEVLTSVAQSGTVSTPNNLYSRRGTQVWKWQYKYRSKGLIHKRAPYCDLQPPQR